MEDENPNRKRKVEAGMASSCNTLNEDHQQRKKHHASTSDHLDDDHVPPLPHQEHDNDIRSTSEVDLSSLQHSIPIVPSSSQVDLTQDAQPVVPSSSQDTHPIFPSSSQDTHPIVPSSSQDDILAIVPYIQPIVTSQPRDLSPPDPYPNIAHRSEEEQNRYPHYQPVPSDLRPVVINYEMTSPPQRWATKRRASVKNLAYFNSLKDLEISGSVKCKSCKATFNVYYPMPEKFRHVAQSVNEILAVGTWSVYLDPPEQWTKPTLETCKYCHRENSCEPYISDKKRSINWLFLLLGQFIGCCSFKQLRYFFKHNSWSVVDHSNEDWVTMNFLIANAYLKLCAQIDPEGVFFKRDVIPYPIG